MSSYSSTSVSSYDPASSSDDDHSSPSTSPSSSSPPSPLFLRKGASTPPPHSPISPISPSVPSTPHRTRTLTRDARPQGIGADPAMLVGKTLTRVRRSRAHPCTTLHFADGSAFQILVVGYDPHFPGIPKTLESDSPVLNPRGPTGGADVRLTVTHAAAITLSDKAFQAPRGAAPDAKEDRWTQRHAAFALKFEEELGWHCVWATMAEYDEEDAERCVFRNYADVYLDRLHPHPSTAHGAAIAASSGTPPASPQKANKFRRRNTRGKPPPHDSTPKARW